jgi:hypothetical protein
MLRGALAACAAALVTAQVNVGAPVFSSVTGEWSLTTSPVRQVNR